MASDSASTPNDEVTIDELAARTGVPTRTIREYQTLGLVPAPERRGRVGIYRSAHVHRLELIGRLQDRGYSLAGIGDLLTSWQEGHELTDLLGKPIDGPELDKALALVRSNGGVPAAVALGRSYADRAAQAAAALGDGEASGAMAAAGHALLDSLGV